MFYHSLKSKCCTLAFHWKKEPRSALSFERPVSLLFSALSKRME